MATYVAMLRGINVGGHAKVAMADLRAAFAEMGFDDVQSYIQSGNVVFRSTTGAASLPSTIEHRLDAAFGHGIRVVIRTRPQLAAVVAGNPFTGGGRDLSKLHVTFLASKPAPSRVGGLDTGAFLPDEFRVAGREVYLHCPGGYGQTKINNAYFERALGVVATTRTWNTVRTLAAMGA
ncbi:MAG: DUF1697 domain-containing protein [Acidimicrobiales bacterium]